jgi:glycosyltransferase involved in cell wall biosynthesis
MHITFLVIEDVTSGLFRTQVLDLARTISDLEPEVSIRIVAVNRPWKLRSHQIALRRYRELLSVSNVSITYIPLLPPLRGAVDNPIVSEVLVTLLRLCSAFVNLFWSVDVWHARGYWAAMALQRNRRKNLLFDPRSLWILENQSAGNLMSGSKSSQYWVKNEKAIAESSRYITVVSKGMKEYFNQRYYNPSIDVIPISAKETFFNYDSEARVRRRHQIGWQDQVIFVYSGSLGLSGINVTAIAELFRYVMSYGGARLLILTDESADRVDNLMSMSSLQPSQFAVIRQGHGEIEEWLSAADVGLHALPRQLDSDTRLGTKVVEYWASGLPVLVNNHVGAACDYIQENNFLGRAINFEIVLPNIETLVREILESPRGVIQKFAKENFSSNKIGRKYLQAYKLVAAENAT